MTAVATRTVEVTAQRDAWVSMLSAAGRIANWKPIPALGCVYLKVETSRVLWWATDGELWRGGVLDVEGCEPGEALLPVGQALAFIKTLPGGSIGLRFDDNGRAVLKAGRFQAKIPSHAVADYPPPPDVALDGWTLPAAPLRTLIGHALISVHATSGLYYQRGAQIALTERDVFLRSSDGHRISVGRLSHGLSDVTPFDAILPAKTLHELSALIDGVKEVVYAVDYERHVFMVGTDQLISRTIVDRFPDVVRPLPKSSTCTALVGRDGFALLVKRVALACDVTSVRSRLVIERGAIEMSADSAARGDAVDRVNAAVDGDGLTLYMRPSYISDFLDESDAEQVTVEFASDALPVIFRPDVDGVDLLYAVMPMRP